MGFPSWWSKYYLSFLLYKESTNSVHLNQKEIAPQIYFLFILFLFLIFFFLSYHPNIVMRTKVKGVVAVASISYFFSSLGKNKRYYWETMTKPFCHSKNKICYRRKTFYDCVLVCILIQEIFSWDLLFFFPFFSFFSMKKWKSQWFDDDFKTFFFLCVIIGCTCTDVSKPKWTTDAIMSQSIWTYSGCSVDRITKYNQQQYSSTTFI